MPDNRIICIKLMEEKFKKLCENKCMKVLMINASDKSTSTLKYAIQILCDSLESNQIAYEVIQLEQCEVHPCTSCGKCLKRRRCIFDGIVNEIADKSDTFDALVIATDVLYGEVNKRCLDFMNCLFRSSNEKYVGKIGGVILAAKRNSEKAYHLLNSYFSYAYMPIITGRHMNTIHDVENIDEIRYFGNNVAKILLALKQNPLDKIQVDRLDEFMLGR